MTAQAVQALNEANRRRGEIAATRAAVQSGEITIGSLMADPPEHLLRLPLADIARFRWPSRTWCRRLEILGRNATRDGVNLLVPLGRASEFSRRWLARETAGWFK